MPEAIPRHVFVYGTLRRGECNDINRLRPTPRYVGMGQVPGTLYLIAHYPGLVLDGPGMVVGEVYEIEPALEAVLDGIEEIVPGDDSEYFKREVSIVVRRRSLRCLVYEVNPRRAQGRPALATGDWVVFTRQK